MILEKCFLGGKDPTLDPGSGITGTASTCCTPEATLQGGPGPALPHRSGFVNKKRIAGLNESRRLHEKPQREQCVFASYGRRNPLHLSACRNSRFSKVGLTGARPKSTNSLPLMTAYPLSKSSFSDPLSS